ncbi:uncharacterized protein E0L32_001169 [Thyridium curvatum]|uniref:Zn(2)-C6 fungal-type domain-containing protein n=1 Tax=Thyridium curvatum TaxID=1093900 RepID=A0A507B2Q4_9PEZI|nr:uncharacterized protein E0L32_001169 [Thyridium curvatum]TPX11351.1 hypothetical protein E0L32_001169 [Thyridium curvatum]
MSGARTKTGCWTCRLRRKKCDEGLPACSSCISRDLYCYGYGEKPAWMLSKGNWQQVLDSDEAKAIRKGAERAYTRRRQRRLHAGPASEAVSVLVQDLGEPAQPHAPSDMVTSPDRTWSNCAQTLRDCDYSPDYQSVQTFLEVIFPLQWGFFNLHRQPSRRWLFDMIVASEPLYHASCGLRISFESGVQSGDTSGRCQVTPAVRSSRMLAMRGLQPYLADIGQDPLNDTLLRKATQAIGVILLLSSLEVFGETEGAWEVHQNAAGSVLDLIEANLAPATKAAGDIGPIGELLASPTPSFEIRALDFFVVTYVWTDIFAEATHGETYSKPRKFDYIPLLQSNLIDARSIMGCRNSVMTAIKEVSMFAASLEQKQKDDAVDAGIALASHIQALIQEATCSFDVSSKGPEADSKWVTLLHAHAALVYLHTVAAHASLDLGFDMQETVLACVELLEALPYRLFIRVCWPFTVTGCMVEEAHQPRFRAMLERVEAAGHVLGFTWKGLMVMEECWRLRRSKPESLWCWRTTVKHMQARILLI